MMTGQATQVLVSRALKITALSRRDFARLIGVAERTVGRWLAGESGIRSRADERRIRELMADAQLPVRPRRVRT